MHQSFGLCPECNAKYDYFDGEVYLKRKKKKPEEGDERIRKNEAGKMVIQVLRSGKWQEKK